MSAGARTVSGSVRLVEPLAAPGGTLHVRVAEVSRVDAPSRIMAERDIAVPGPLAAGSEVPFALVVVQVENVASYIVQAHLDVTGSGTIDPGDRLSMEAYPVLTRGHSDHVTVEARTV